MDRIRRLLRPIAEVRTYERILYLLLALPLGVLEALPRPARAHAHLLGDHS